MEKSKKKILYIWKSPYPWDVRVEKICRSLSKKYDVMILARWGGETKRTEYINGIKIRRVGFKKRNVLSTPISINPLWKYEIERAINDYLPTLIIVREIMLGSVAGKLSKKYNIPIAMDMAENYPAALRYWKKYNNTVIKRLVYNYSKLPFFIEKNSLRYMSGIMVVCKEQIQRLYKNYNYPESKTKVIRNTPSTDYFSNKDFERINLIHHGWLTSEKSFHKFLKLILAKKDELDNIKFIISGDGENLNEYKSIVKESNVENIFEFTGTYKFDELKKILNKGNIGMLPYEDNEFNRFTLHNKIFDYFSAGMPVIVSEIHH